MATYAFVMVIMFALFAPGQSWGESENLEARGGTGVALAEQRDEAGLVDADWVDHGWDLFETEVRSKAIQLWQKGFRSLPSDQKVLFGGVYLQQSAALRQLSHLGRELQAIIVQAPYKNKSAWYVLSVPDEGNLAAMKQRLKPLMDGRVYASESSRFQGDVHAKVAEEHNLSLARADRAESGAEGSGWVERGWNLLDAKAKSRAVQLWKEGVRSLPSDQQVLFGGVYLQQSAALRQLNKLGRKLKAILVQAGYKNRLAWYVLSVPAEGQLVAMKQRLKPLMGGRVYANEVGRFQGISQGWQKREYAATGVGRKRSASVAMLFIQAKDKLHDGNTQGAMVLLNQLVKRAPEHSEGRLLYGRLLVLAGEYKEGSMILQELLKSGSWNWHPWYWAATASLMLNEIDQADRLINRAISFQGDKALLWLLKGVIEEEKANYSQALNLLNIAAKFATDMPQIYLNIAYCADKMGDKNRANQAYTRFLVLTRNSDIYRSVREKVLTGL